MVEKVRQRLAVSKQRWHKFHMERFNLKKLNEVEGKEPMSGGSLSPQHSASCCVCVNWCMRVSVFTIIVLLVFYYYYHYMSRSSTIQAEQIPNTQIIGILLS
jgi:hypothetical protein